MLVTAADISLRSQAKVLWLDSLHGEQRAAPGPGGAELQQPQFVLCLSHCDFNPAQGLRKHAARRLSPTNFITLGYF